MPVQRLLKAKNPFHVWLELLHSFIPLHSSTSDAWIFHLSFVIFCSRFYSPHVVLLFWLKVEKLRHTFLQLFPFGRSATTFSAKRRGNSTLAPCRMQQYYSDPGPPTPPVSNIIQVFCQYISNIIQVHCQYISNIIQVHCQYSVYISNIIQVHCTQFQCSIYFNVCTILASIDTQ